MASDSDDAARVRAPPEIEDRRALKWITQSSDTFTGLPYSKEDQHDFRPILRPAVPVLTLLDDGSQSQGESIRLRGETFTIGRTSGDLVLPNDQAVSGLHGEIRRVPWKGAHQWHLLDLGSVNGTFVRIVRAVLHAEAIVIIGARRFRLRNPLVTHRRADRGPETRPIDASRLPETVWPVLEETTHRAPGIVAPLKNDTVTIGRTGGGCDIQLDDPLVADRHAQLERQRDGSWRIVAETTRNGVWVSISTATLTPHCHFRCGEQIFRFEIP
ncbi:MAG: FHA domain-containing protein [Planctomycetaceae bacterium]